MRIIHSDCPGVKPARHFSLSLRNCTQVGLVVENRIPLFSLSPCASHTHMHTHTHTHTHMLFHSDLFLLLLFVIDCLIIFLCFGLIVFKVLRMCGNGRCSVTLVLIEAIIFLFKSKCLRMFRLLILMTFD